MASRKQTAANRRNAQLSTGPTTPQGKAAVSLNALKHGLTAQHAVISTEEAEEFNQVLRNFEDQLQPTGPLEILLVQQIVMAAWRLARLRGMETGLFECRLLDLKGDLEEYTNLTRHDKHAHVFLDDTRRSNAFSTLARYEARIERSLYRALHELQRLQAARPAPPNTSVAKQTQITPETAPNPAPRQDLTPPSSITKSPNPPIANSVQSPIPPLLTLE